MVKSADDEQLERTEEQQIEQELEPLKSAGLGGSSYGGALGAAMFGLEAALRRQPPAQVLVKENEPVRGLSGSDDGLVIEFPDTVDVPSSAAPEAEPSEDR